MPQRAQSGSGLPRTVSPDVRAAGNYPQSEPAGMLEGCFTERHGIVPSVPWPTSVGW